MTAKFDWITRNIDTILKSLVIVVIVFLFSAALQQGAQAEGFPETTSQNVFNSSNSYEIIQATGCQARPNSGPIDSAVDYLSSMLFGTVVDEKSVQVKAPTLSNIQILKCLEENGKEVQDIKKAFINGSSLLNAPFALTDQLYNQPPASGIVYAQQMVHKVTHPGEVYAGSPYFPGLGYETLSVIQPAWSWMVNIIYGLMILVIIVIAFTVLFQNTVGQQSIQLQTAIPNIIVAMVLIPLSYPIAGFAVDFLALGSNLVHGVLLSGPGALGSTIYQDGQGDVKTGVEATGGGVDQILDILVPRGDPNVTSKFNVDGNRGFYIDDPRLSVLRAFALIDLSNWAESIDSLPFLDDANREISAYINSNVCSTPNRDGLTCFLLEVGMSVNGFLTGQLGFQGFGSLISDIVMLVLAFFLFFTGGSLFVNLLIKYIAMLLMPIISPIVFASIAVPGIGVKGITWFIRSLYGSALMFIITYAALVGIVILSQDGLVTPDNFEIINEKSFNPPLISGLGIDELTDVTGDVGVEALGIDFVLDVVAIALFFALPVLLARVERALELQLDLSFLKDIGAGFQLSRGLAGVTARTGAEVVRGASQAPRQALRRTVQYLDRSAPLGKQGYTQNRKEAAQNRARANEFQRTSGEGFNKVWANTVGRRVVDARNTVALAGTGLTAEDVRPKGAPALSWNFISANNQMSQTRIVIRTVSMSTNMYRNNVQFEIQGEGDRIYGEGKFTTRTKPTQNNTIDLRVRGNPTIKATLVVNNGTTINFDGKNGTGSANFLQLPYYIRFHAGPPAAGQTYEVDTPSGPPLYAWWYRPNKSASQDESPRALVVTIE